MASRQQTRQERAEEAARVAAFELHDINTERRKNEEERSKIRSPQEEKRIEYQGTKSNSQYYHQQQEEKKGSGVIDNILKSVQGIIN